MVADPVDSLVFSGGAPMEVMGIAFASILIMLVMLMLTSVLESMCRFIVHMVRKTGESYARD